MEIQYSKTNITKGRLNRMCKYFRNKRVNIRYIYDNSLGMYSDRKLRTKYDSFEIEESQYRGDSFYVVKFIRKGKVIWEQDFNSSSAFEFTGVGQIRECNSGPYCYFSITKRIF